jgi:phosphoribosylanthranilate isomerase
MTNLEDALEAIELGADAVGFIFHQPSPRYVKPELAGEIVSRLPPLITTVGVFVNWSIEEIRRMTAFVGLDVVQLHGNESPEICQGFSKVVKAFRIQNYEDLQQLEPYKVSAFLLDAFTADLYGGSGKSFNWDIARQAQQYGPIILAGGLNPDNIEEAILQAQPYAVDAVSGVESVKGKKDYRKMKAFIHKAKCL